MRVLWIGDSISQGMTPTLKRALGSLGWSGVVDARVGWSTVRWQRDGSLSNLLTQYHPDLVVFALGTNPDGEAALRDAAFALDDEARTFGAKVIWIGSFTDNEMNNRLRYWFSGRVASGTDLAVGINRTADGVHFYADGYAELARRCADAVRRLVSKSSWWAGLLLGTVVLGLGYFASTWKPEAGDTEP